MSMLNIIEEDQVGLLISFYTNDNNTFSKTLYVKFKNGFLNGKDINYYLKPENSLALLHILPKELNIMELLNIRSYTANLTLEI